jgi:hypothetical protein
MARGRRVKSRRQRLVSAAAAGQNAISNHYVIYLHGICKHARGYSDPWWAAMKPFVPSIPEDNRREVIWSDVVAPTNSLLARRKTNSEKKAVKAAKKTELVGLIRDTLEDRAQRQLSERAVANTDQQRAIMETTTQSHPFLVTRPVPQAAFLGIPDLECIEDFTDYLLDDDIRNRVIERFNEVVKPLLRAGNSLEVISHSWGTVVAYEALRRTDSDGPDNLDQVVSNLFTVGSALAIPPVKRLLQQTARDGHKPRRVRTWINLNAHFDIVGGHLRGNPFEVDYEYLELPPVGCSQIIPNPTCAHSSYFQLANELVNRQIFGKWISRR